MSAVASVIAVQVAQLLGSAEALYPQYASQASVYATPESRVATRLLKIPKVESVYIHRKSDIFEVWTIIDQDDESVTDSIYEIERSLIRDLKESFDFHVVARSGRPLRSLITINYRGWIRP